MTEPMHMTAREILDKLVSFPTVSRDTNLPLVDWVEDYLASHGVVSHRVYDETGQKASLLANVGPEVAGGVVLSGHTDVVPVDGQDWVTDPWEVVEKDGRLYGRGTTDMKGFDALALAIVPHALKAGIKKPIQIAFSYDEEVGLLGAPGLVKGLRANVPDAAAVLIGEPTGMRVVSGHKSCDAVYVYVRGFEVHSSKMHEGVSAIMIAARLIEWLRARGDTNRAVAPNEVDGMFDPPYSTLHVGMINGGTAHNITAKDCNFTVDIRNVPSDLDSKHFLAFKAFAAELEVEMKQISPDAGITVRLGAPGPGVKPEVDGAAELLARQLTGDNSQNTVPYGTDGGHFQLGGYSTVVCGPGDIALAHQPNEFITIAQFEAGEAFLHRLVDHLAS